MSTAEAPDVRAFSLISSAGRIAIGVGMLAAPEPALRALGFSDVGPATAALGRIAGIRDLVLGAATLAAFDDPARLRAATLANAVADAGDAAGLRDRACGPTSEPPGSGESRPRSRPRLAGIWVAWRLS